MTVKKQPANRSQLTGKRIEVVEVRPTVDTNAYSSGDSIGGLQTIAAATLGDLQGAKLIGVSVIDRDSSAPDMTILFFDEAPDGTFTNNAAMALSADEADDKLIGTVEINNGDWTVLATGQDIVEKAPNIPVYAQADGTIYAAVISDGTPTLGDTDSLVFKYFFEYGA